MPTSSSSSLARAVRFAAPTPSADQVEGLEHKADLAAAQGGKLAVLRGGHVDAVQPVAALGGLIQRAHNVHQGGLAAAGLAHNGYELALIHVQVNAVQDFQLVGLADVKGFHDAPQLDDGLLFSAHAIASGSARLRSSIPSVRPSPLTSTDNSVSMPVVTGMGVKVTLPSASVSLR